MKGKILLLFVILIIPMLPACGQKALKEVRSLLKEKKAKEAAVLIDKLCSDTNYNKMPKLYDLGIQAQIQLNNVENEKIYLQKPYDTLNFFRTTYNIIDFILKCDNAERTLLAEKGKKMKFHKNNRTLLHHYFTNLNAAGRYYYKHQQFDDVILVMDKLLEIPKMAIWGDDKSFIASKTYTDNVFIFQHSSFIKNKFENVCKYKDITLSDTTHRRYYIEMLSLTAEATHDTLEYLKNLELGLKYYPTYPMFFSRLVDYYNSKGNYEKSLLLADSLLNHYCTNLLFLESKSLSLLNLQKNQESIQTSLYTLKINPSAIESLYYIGVAYCNLAQNITLPLNFNSKEYKSLSEKQKSYYQMALPYIEKYRNLCPEQKLKWGPLLYRIYLSLNKGKEFDEIDNILNKTTTHNIS